MESNGGNIPSVDTNLSFFHLPFVDNANTDLVFSDRNKSQESAYDDFQNALPSHNYLGTDDVLAQILSADEPLEEPDLNGPTTLHCEICKKKFDKAKKYYGHLRVHSKDNVWVCDKCPDKRFSVKQQLMKHSLIHTPLRKIWPCPQCSMTFEALWRLQQHLFYKHLNYRTHKCDLCDKVFNKSSDLKRHMDKHSDRKRFSCPKCGAKFKLKSNMKSHLLRHDNKQTFVCSGCNRSYTQLVSLTRHMKRCPHYINRSDANEPNTRNLCRICGLTFPYRTNLLEHCIRQHTHPPVEDKKEKCNQVNVESNRTVDNIVDDILSVEADYLKMATPNEILNVYNNQNESEANADNRVQKEFLKEMNQLHILDDELFYNDLDIDCLQSNHMFNMNTNDMDYIAMDRNNEECHLTAELNDNNGIDDGIINSLCHVKCEYLPDELLNVTKEVPSLEETHVNKVPPLSINDCSTIFESDVDLEASTNLAANLNQLIGENTVQYISTEEDDTFIISLNCGIDAEQLTGMLNIGRELVEDNRAVNGIDELKTSDIPKTNIKDVECDVETIKCIMKNNKRFAESTEVDGDIIESVSAKIEINKSKRKKSIKRSKGKVETLESAMSIDEKDNNSAEDEDIIESIKIEIDNDDLKTSKGGVKKSEKTNGDEKITKRVIYVCLICNKTFSKRDNYNSHCAVHEPKLRRHKCDVCGDRFSYKSTLNKHYKMQHTPCVLSHPHSCAHCQRQFAAAWMLKNHEERDHKKMTPFHCDYKDCNRKFYKKFDLVVHKRYHNGERPHKCSECGLSFAHVSHLRRHARNVVCAKPAQRVNK